MFKEFHVLIIEDDPYASDIMMMLLARDYRTRVMGELSNRVNIERFTSLETLLDKDKVNEHIKSADFEVEMPIDVIILDTEVPWNTELPIRIIEKISMWNTPPKILCTSTYPSSNFIRKFLEYPCFAGYLVKQEASYSLASAVCLAAENYCVLTPQVSSVIEKEIGRGNMPLKTLVISSPTLEEIQEEFNQVAREIIKLGLIFNMSQFDIHDELFVAESWVAKIISRGYSMLNIPDIVSGDILLSDLFDNQFIDNKKIVGHYKNIFGKLRLSSRQKRSKGTNRKSPKFKTMSTLAFHLLTLPKIEEWQ